MIDKEELLIRIEDSLTTRMVKELFKNIVEQCRDVPIENGFRLGWNACLEEIAENANCSKETEK